MQHVTLLSGQGLPDGFPCGPTTQNHEQLGGASQAVYLPCPAVASMQGLHSLSRAHENEVHSRPSVGMGRTHTACQRQEGLDEQQSQCQPAGSCSQHPSARPSWCADCHVPQGSQGICVPGQLMLLMGLQYNIATYDVGGAFSERLNEVLVTLGWALAWLHMESRCLQSLHVIML